MLSFYVSAQKTPHRRRAIKQLRRIAHGVLEELRRINPTIPDKGHRKSKHHQWFTPELGHPKLKEHLAAVTALMRAAPNWEAFKRSLVRAFPKPKEQIPFGVDEN